MCYISPRSLVPPAPAPLFVVVCELLLAFEVEYRMWIHVVLLLLLLAVCVHLYMMFAVTPALISRSCFLSYFLSGLPASDYIT